MSMEVTVQFNVFHALHSAGVLTSTDEKYPGQEYQERPDVGQWVSHCLILGLYFFFCRNSQLSQEIFIYFPPQPVWPCVKRSVRQHLDGREYQPVESLSLLANQMENTMLLSATRPLVCVGVLIREESKSKAQGLQVYQAVEWWVSIHIFPFLPYTNSNLANQKPRLLSWHPATSSHLPNIDTT